MSLVAACWTVEIMLTINQPKKFTLAPSIQLVSILTLSSKLLESGGT